MMTRTWVQIVGVGAIVAACSTTTTGTGAPPPSPCPNVVGNWKIFSTRVDGDCDAAKFGDNESDVTIRKADDGGAFVLVLPGFGGGCPGDFDGATCKFVANCDLISNGKKVGSGGIDWTFNGTKLSGSEISLALPPRVDKVCKANYSDEGTKL